MSAPRKAQHLRGIIKICFHHGQGRSCEGDTFKARPPLCINYKVKRMERFFKNSNNNNNDNNNNNNNNKKKKKKKNKKIVFAWLTLSPTPSHPHPFSKNKSNIDNTTLFPLLFAFLHNRTYRSHSEPVLGRLNPVHSAQGAGAEEN